MFLRYVQVCSVKRASNFKLGERFEYKVIGIGNDGSLSPYKNDKISSRIYDPESGENLEMIVVADWSQLYQKKYVTLQASFDYLLKKTAESLERHPHALRRG